MGLNHVDVEKTHSHSSRSAKPQGFQRCQDIHNIQPVCIRMWVGKWNFLADDVSVGLVFYIATWVSSARYTGWLASWLVSGHWEKVCDSISFFCGWLPPGMNRDSPKRRREVRWMISSKRSAPRCFHKSSWNSRATLSISLSLAVCSFLGLVGYLIYSCI